MDEIIGENKNTGVEKSPENVLKDQKEKIQENESVTVELQTAIDKIPKEFREEVTHFLMGNISRPTLESKITGEHLHKLLDYDDKSDERKFKDAQQSRKFQLAYVLLAVLLFVFLAIFLVGKDTELFKEIVKLFIVFVGGIGAGFGIKTYKSKK